ncbi:MAG: type II toxin-antitoxin system RelE/ParE family toxin [Erysipelotrichaceae bacterium]|nr:type II toxin-antitoxin system RelE/ParE family toxin [Erysipelotrichaceae bacterium]
MYQIKFYKDRRGNEPVRQFLEELSVRKDRRSVKLYRLIVHDIEYLSRYGFAVGMPRIRRIDEEVWELRPKRYRIFFFAFHEDCFILLHHFYKKTEKTPRSEIKKAHREMEYYLGKE